MSEHKIETAESVTVGNKKTISRVISTYRSISPRVKIAIGVYFGISIAYGATKYYMSARSNLERCREHWPGSDAKYEIRYVAERTSMLECMTSALFWPYSWTEDIIPRMVVYFNPRE